MWLVSEDNGAYGLDIKLGFFLIKVNIIIIAIINVINPVKYIFVFFIDVLFLQYFKI
jgi:hypothetical protein